jgi:hypothetical protein
VKRFLCRLLRSLLHRLEGLESDDELRARMLGLIRSRPASGSRDNIEAAIRDVTPAPMEVLFTWDSPLMKGDRLKLTVVWR